MARGIDQFAGAAAITRPAVVITGASEGIGREIARCYAAKNHYALLLIARRQAKLQEAADACRLAGATEVAVQAVDLLEEAAGERIEKRLEELGWHCEILVNNAASGLSGPFLEQPPESISDLLRLNIEVPIALMRRFVPQMRTRGSGGVLNVSSLAGYVPGPWQATYYASKAFLLSFSKSLAEELRTTGVTVTVVAPGPLRTRFHEKMSAGNARYVRYMPLGSPRWVARMATAGLDWGIRVVLPGPVTAALVLATRAMPNFLLAPLMGWLLDKPHDSKSPANRGEVNGR
ncbi:MAG: hypothetical protein RLZ98_1683 [Pseudomonadota bacterium]|jgi:short-subunit dehydrogenase